MTPQEIEQLKVGDIVYDKSAKPPYVLCRVTDTPATIKRKYQATPELYIQDCIEEDEFWFVKLSDGESSYGYLQFYEHWDTIPD